MSRVVSKKEVEDIKTEEAAPVSIPGLNEEENFAVSDGPETKTTRVLWECRATADQLAKGHIVELGNTHAVFDIENSDKAIVSEIVLTSAYSDCSEPITIGMNLFNTNSSDDLCVINSNGYLHSPLVTDFGNRVVGGSAGYRNLTGLLPYENSRQHVSIYKPQNAINDRYLQKYGGLSREKLMEGVIPFPGEGYCLVSDDHVVLSVIQANWESLGLDLSNEVKYNSKYMQIPTPVFEKVVSDLETEVLNKLPFSSMSNLCCKFSTKRAKDFADPNPNEVFHAVVEMKINYTLPPAAKETPSV